MDLVYQRWVIWVRQMDLIFNGAWKFSHLSKCVIKSQNNSVGTCVPNQYKVCQDASKELNASMVSDTSPYQLHLIFQW